MTSTSAAPPSGPVPARPASILLVSVLLALEGLGALVAAGWYLLSIGQEGPVSMAGRIFMLALLVGAGVWQILVANFVFRGRAWTRAAAVGWQVFQVIFAVSFLGGGMWLVGLALLLPAAAVMLFLFDPRATAFFGDRSGPAGGHGDPAA